MALHTLLQGSTIIDGLVRLGEALGYVAVRELPVEQRRRNPPAVDVAWLAEEAHRFPLMIFEVESKATNSASNNPVKVYGQSSDQFEKPLFFFHVFLHSGAESTRVDNLLRLFGSHNYRAYRLHQDGLEPLLRDILTQHRRLQRSLQLAPLLDVTTSPPWEGVSPQALAAMVERLEFQASFLASYAARAQNDPRYRVEHLRLLRDSDSPYGPKGQVADYQGFLGQEWAPPIHLGILALTEPDVEWLDRLREWQERWSYMSMIGPHFGLSRDYDDFVLGRSPVLWALTAALMYKVPGAGAYILSQLIVVLERLDRASPAISFFTAIWTLHVASAIVDDEQYRLAQAFINDRGGVAPEVLFEPPSAVGIMDQDDEWEEALAEEREPVPDLAEFRRRLPPHYSRISDLDEELYQFAYGLLTSDEQLYDWSGMVALSLHTSHGTLPVRAIAV